MIDFHILVQALLYFSVFVSGFVISIPIGVNRINFNGVCILYGDFDWYNATHFKMTGSSDSNCNFPIYFSVFGLIFYGLATGLYNMYAVIRSRIDPDIGSQMWVMPFILVNALLAFTTLIVACMVSVGFKQFCDGFEHSGTYSSCIVAERIRWRNEKTGKLFDPGPMFKLLTVSQAAAWLCLLVWIIQVVFCIFRFVRNRRRRSEQMINNAQGGQTSDTAKIAELEPTA